MRDYKREEDEVAKALAFFFLKWSGVGFVAGITIWFGLKLFGFAQ